MLKMLMAIAGQAGGGSVPVFNPDPDFTSARVGGFWYAPGFYQDSGNTDLADQEGDLIYNYANLRTVPGPVVGNISQGSVGNRALAHVDPTHGIVARFPAGTNKWAIGMSNSILGTAISNNGGTFVSRFKVTSAAGISTAGHSLVAYDRTEKGLLMAKNGAFGNVAFGAGPSSTARLDLSPYDGQWVTVAGRYTPGSTLAELYLNDPETPAAVDASEVIVGMTRLIFGQPAAGFSTEVLVHKQSLIDDNSRSIADWMQWAEASN